MKAKNLLDDDNPTLDMIVNILLGLPLLGLIWPTLGKYLLIIVISLIGIGLVLGKFVGEKVFRIALWGFTLYGLVYLVRMVY